MNNAVSWRCAACGASLDIATLFPWRCPTATTADRHHVLRIVRAPAAFAARSSAQADDQHPYVAFDNELAWAAFAAARGMTTAARHALVYELDAAVRTVGGTGFRVTPFERHEALSDALDFSAGGGVWVKDETANVGGSHKARHLFTILLHLRASEVLGLAPWADASARPSLAIASCGNAAIAAATLAAAVRWPIDVFVPPWASESVVTVLRDLGATLNVCPRLDTDPSGDPCIYRFREAVAAGAVPFSVQGPENALCLDGGIVLGREMVTQMRATATRELDRVFVQVGGGALATGMGDALAVAGAGTHLAVVQTEGCAPLDRAWRRAQALAGGIESAAGRWSECMWPWEPEPASAADGILDDETYDWVGVVTGLAASDGVSIVASEAHVIAAYEMARRLTAINVSATGTAGLAGLLAERDRVADGERVAVVFSGIDR